MNNNLTSTHLKFSPDTWKTSAALNKENKREDKLVEFVN